MTTLVFRTETTALARMKLPPGDEKQPRIMLLSAISFDRQRREAGFQFSYIRPDGWTADRKATEVHGITAPYCDSPGIRIHSALAAFMDLVRSATEIVAYDLEFHSHMIEVEISRLGAVADAARRDWRRGGMKRTCAMLAAGNLANAGKKMKLRDAHLALVEQDFDDRKNPVEAARAVARIHFATVDRGY